MRNKSFKTYIQKAHVRGFEIVESDIYSKKLRKHCLWNHKVQLNDSVEKPFVCDICDLKFRMKHLITKHIMDKHSGVRTCKCKYYPLAYATSTNLYKHEIIHLKGTLPEDDPKEKE